MPDDAEKTSQIFDILLGDNLPGRKDYIVENGYKYIETADVSWWKGWYNGKKKGWT